MSALVAASAVASGVVYSCPHGTLVGVFGVGIAHSAAGGPCHNGVRGLQATHLFGDWYLWRG